LNLSIKRGIFYEPLLWLNLIKPKSKNVGDLYGHDQAHSEQGSGTGPSPIPKLRDFGETYPASIMRYCFCSAVSFFAWGSCTSMRDFESFLRLRENAIAKSPSKDGNTAP
jgi:hypothetical protein